MGKIKRRLAKPAEHEDQTRPRPSVYDGTMTYANFKTLLNSDEMGHFLNSDVFRQTTASLVMSLNGAFS
ncbi:hypothetical protein [Hafnia paralvei]|uniref:hypothetical protein n=2 Tax=Enterobacterales TaxID=91347 RepID=UPI00163CF76E|nr:hypothetical protein [Hafnia paralvei]